MDARVWRFASGFSGRSLAHFGGGIHRKIPLGMIKCHTMNKSKIAITVSPLVLNRLDAWVQSEHFASRSEAIEQAVEAQLQRLERTRLSEQCALLDVAEEQAMADIGLATDAATWPAF
jgi:Arc/MetJ-type ribon-helix-helix transcriptional regulator